jgi:hypothetical protein
MKNNVIYQDNDSVIEIVAKSNNFLDVPSNEYELLEYMAKISLDNIILNNSSDNYREPVISHAKCSHKLLVSNSSDQLDIDIIPRELKLIPIHYDELYSVYTNTLPDVVMGIMKKELDELEIEYKYNTYKTKIRGISEDLSFTIKIFKGNSNGEYLIEMHRRSGSREIFVDLYQHLCNAMSNVIVRKAINYF